MELVKGGLMTTKEFAELVGIHEVTVRRLCRSGDIPSVKVGKSWRILKDRALAVQSK